MVKCWMFCIDWTVLESKTEKCSVIHKYFVQTNIQIYSCNRCDFYSNHLSCLKHGHYAPDQYMHIQKKSKELLLAQNSKEREKWLLLNLLQWIFYIIRCPFHFLVKVLHFNLPKTKAKQTKHAAKVNHRHYLVCLITSTWLDQFSVGCTNLCGSFEKYQYKWKQ